MLGMVIWDKLLGCIFENMKLPERNEGYFKNHEGDLSPKLSELHKANKHFVLKQISFNSGELQISKQAIIK